MRAAKEAWAGIDLMLIVVLTVIVPSALAGPVEAWNRTFGGVSHDPGGSGRLTSDGGFLVTSLTSSHGAGGDMFLVKADSNGTEQWNRAYGGRSMDLGRSVPRPKTAVTLSQATPSSGVPATPMPGWSG